MKQYLWIVVGVSIIFLVIICLITFRSRIPFVSWSQTVEEILQSIENEDCTLYTGCERYRLGDMVRFLNERENEGGEEYHKKHFPTSIACEYMNQTRDINRIDILTDIVKKRSKGMTGDPVVFNIRVGDVIDNATASLADILTDYTLQSGIGIPEINYSPPLRYFQDKFADLRSLGIKEVVIVSASHTKGLKPKSCKYIFAVKKYFEQNGFIVKTKLGQHPDIDFLAMCNAKVFIPSTNGGFSHLAAAVCKSLGNNVLYLGNNVVDEKCGK
jgi:hypothetical protein